MRVTKFELEVLVGGQPLTEYVLPATGDTYVETRFNTPVSYQVQVQESDPYGEQFMQRWPVTPYELRVTNHSDDTVRAMVYIDGKRASKQFVRPGQHTIIKGFKDHSSSSAPFREFLFSLPRRVRGSEAADAEQLNAAQKAALAAALESIRVELFLATFTGKSRDMRPSGRVAAGMDAVNKALAKGGDAAAASAAGREHGGGRAAVQRSVRNFVIGPLQATLTMRYTQRHKLENLGLIAPADAAGGGVKREAAGAGAAGAAGGGVKRSREGGASARPKDEVVDLT